MDFTVSVGPATEGANFETVWAWVTTPRATIALERLAAVPAFTDKTVDSILGVHVPCIAVR